MVILVFSIGFNVCIYILNDRYIPIINNSLHFNPHPCSENIKPQINISKLSLHFIVSCEFKEIILSSILLFIYYCGHQSWRTATPALSFPL